MSHKQSVYRMKFLHILGWTIYILFTRAMWAAVILLAISFIAIPLNLDSVLRTNFSVLLAAYFSLFIAFILLQLANKIVYLEFDDSKLILVSLLRRYSYKWSEIESIGAIVTKPRFIGLGSWLGTDERTRLVIKGKSKTLTVQLSHGQKGFYWRDSFYSTSELVTTIKNRWSDATKF